MIFILLLFILTTYGLSNMVVYSNGPFKMFSKWRDFTNWIHPSIGELFSCMMCFPFWAAAILSSIDVFVFKNAVMTPFNLVMFNECDGIYKYIFVIAMDGVFGSGTTWILHNIEEYFENKSKE